MYYNRINTVVSNDNATDRRRLRVLDGGVPEPSETSTAQETFDFNSVANEEVKRKTEVTADE